MTQFQNTTETRVPVSRLFTQRNIHFGQRTFLTAKQILKMRPLGHRANFFDKKGVKNQETQGQSLPTFLFTFLAWAIGWTTENNFG